MTLVIGVAVAIVALDQITKTWALRALRDRDVHVIATLRFHLTLNRGIAFSQATGSTAVVTSIALAVVAVVGVIAWRTRGTALAWSLGLVIGGAAGNLADRLIRHQHGAVTDFIDLRWWPVFNVADAAISCGVVLALLIGGRHESATRSAERAEVAGPAGASGPAGPPGPGG